jgi:hypothetical protein
MEIKVLMETATGDFKCPFQTDLNTCCLIEKSKINFCPDYKEETEDTKNVAPASCPLRTSTVIVSGQFKYEPF